MQRISSLWVALLLAVATTAAHAHPTPHSCDALFLRLRSITQADPAEIVHALWSTSYLAHGVRYAGWTEINLRRIGPPGWRDLFGEGQRHRTLFNSDGVFTDVEKVSLEIRTDGKIMLSQIYGPYDPECAGDRFAVVHTGDSVEVINFRYAGDNLQR